MLSERQPDVTHSNGFKTHILAAWAAPRSSRVIWHVHDYAGARPLMSRLMRAHARRCDIAIANSNSVARDLAAVCGARLRIRTLYNAVDLERFTPCGPKLDLDTLCALPPAPPATVRVGLVATMARWKGHEVFLRALSMLVGRAAVPAMSAAAPVIPLPAVPSVRGYIIGGPIYTTRASQYTIAELRAVAAKIGLNGNIGFTGYVKDAPAAIRALDIVVHASTQPEPFGLAVAEAMACGKPVVASNAGGVGEIIRENESALGHKPGDAQALARTIERLAGQPDLCRRLGTQARREALARFDQDRLAREAVAIYAAPSFRLVNAGTGIPVS